MTGEISQNHYGKGDNVGRDKIIYSMHSSDLKTVIHSIMSMILFQQYEESKQHLELLDQIESKNHDIECIIKILNIYYTYCIDKNIIKEKKAEIKDIIRRMNENPLILDLALYILIYINGDKNKEESSLIFNNIDNKDGYYSRSIYNKILASEDELKEYFNTKHFILSSYELIHICLGFCRHFNYEFANKTLSIIQKTIDNRFITALSLGIKLDEINRHEEYQPVMYTEKETSQKIINISKDFYNAISNYEKLINHEVKILVVLLIQTGFSVQAVIDLGFKFINQIKILDSNIAETLDKIKNIDDLKPNENLLLSLKNGISINEQDAINISNLLYTEKIEVSLIDEWITKGGITETEDNVLKDFLDIFFKSFIFLKLDKEYSDINAYKETINKFVETHGSNIKTLLPSTIVNLCNNLRSLNKPFFHEIKEIIEPILPEKNFISPLYIHYLNSLLALEQYISLQKHLDSISEHEWNFELLIIQSSCYALNENYEDAKKFIDKAIENYNSNAYVWLNKLNIELNITPWVELKRILHEIPEEVFFENSNYVFPLLNFISSKIDYVFAQRKIASLFISDPLSIANDVCRLHFNALSTRIDFSHEPIEYPKIRYGVEYEFQSKIHFKLLIDSSSKNSNFINSSSVLGKILSNLKVGEVGEYDFDDIKLLQIIPAEVALFRIAKNIVEENRHLSNKNPDFYTFTVSDADPAQDIIKMMKRFDLSNVRKEKLADKSISMYLKGKWIIPDNEVEAALCVLQNADGNSCLYKQNGILIDPKQIILDTYSFIFLCLNNLHQGLIDSKIEVYISETTKNNMQSWVVELSHDSYLNAGLHEGNLCVRNANTIKQEYSIFFNAINKLMKYSKTLPPKTIDVPISITSIKDLVSLSIYSSMKDSYSYQIPWLCLDSIINELFKTIDQKLTINLMALVQHLNTNLKFDDKKISLYQHRNYSLITSYKFDDLLKLSKSDEDDDVILLLDLILKSPLIFKNNSQFCNLILIVFRNIIINRSLVTIKDIDSYKIVQLGFNFCCEKFISLNSEKYYEDNFLNFYRQAFNLLSFDKNSLNLVNHLATLYAKGHFLNIEYIKQELLK